MVKGKTTCRASDIGTDNMTSVSRQRNHQETGFVFVILSASFFIATSIHLIYASGSFTGPQNWGGAGWGGAITFTYLRTSMMWGHGTFTCTCAHTSCYVEDVLRHAWGGVGWGEAITFTYLRTSMMWGHGRNWTNPGDVLKNEKVVSVSDSF